MPPSSDTPGPLFTDRDFDQAVSALDLSLQDYSWKPGENRLTAESVLGALKARNITLALATELFRRLIDEGVFTYWSHTVPAGYHRERGIPLPVWCGLPQTTHCLVTTQKRWYDWLAKYNRQRGQAPPAGGDGQADVPSGAQAKPTRGAPAKNARRTDGRDRKLEARNKWIYQQCCKGRGRPLAAILADLKRKAPEKGWAVLSSIQAIRTAAIGYAERHGLALPPNRQNL
jgi:hypothetical protein